MAAPIPSHRSILSSRAEAPPADNMSDADIVIGEISHDIFLIIFLWHWYVIFYVIYIILDDISKYHLYHVNIIYIIYITIGWDTWKYLHVYLYLYMYAHTHIYIFLKNIYQYHFFPQTCIYIYTYLSLMAGMVYHWKHGIFITLNDIDSIYGWDGKYTSTFWGLLYICEDSNLATGNWTVHFQALTMKLIVWNDVKTPGAASNHSKARSQNAARSTHFTMGMRIRWTTGVFFQCATFPESNSGEPVIWQWCCCHLWDSGF